MSYIITGNPGVGKHTVSKEIRKILDLPILDINQIAKESGLYEQNDEANDVDVEELEKILEKKAIFPGLIVGHLAPYVLSSNRIEKVIVLRKNPYELIPIYKQREYSKEKIKENVGSEVLGIIFYDTISKFGEEKTIQLDITSQNLKETTKNVLSAIKGEIKSQEVDWLSMISEEKDLKEFFSY